MTIPTEIQNRSFVSHTFLTFQIDTRQSLAALIAGKLAASIRELRLIELIGGRRGVPFKKQSRIDHLRLQVCLVVFSRPESRFHHAFCPQPLQPRNSRIQVMHAADSTSRGRCTPSCHVRFYLSSSASCRTPPKRCGSPEHEQHLLSSCTHSP